MAETKPRLDAVDLARGLAVLFMICVHTLEVYAHPAVAKSPFGETVKFFGGPPAAPVFMLLMGLSFSYARQKDLKSGILRGIKVCLSGYLLNFLRGVAPLFLAQQSGLSVIKNLTPQQNSLANIFFLGDILQFAGLALIIMTVVRHLKSNRYVIIAIAVLVSAVAPYLLSIRIGIPGLEQLADLFWGDKPLGPGFIGNGVNFPVFPWLTFPLIGMVLGEVFSGSIELARTYAKVGIIGGVIMVIGITIIVPNPDYHLNDYFHSRQGAMVFMAGFTLLWLYLCHLATRQTQKNRAFEFLYECSRNVTTIYFFQWVLIIWGIALFGMSQSSLLTTIVIMLVVTALSFFFSRGYSTFKLGWSANKQKPTSP